MSQQFPKPNKSFEGNINVNVDLSNYAVKADLKNDAGVNTSRLAAKSDVASLKAERNKIDVDKLKSLPVDLKETRGFVSKTTYDAGKSNLEKRISDGDKNNS